MIITNLLSNMVVVVTALNAIQTNTPAFREYAFHAMFDRAAYMATNWNLDIRRPITTNMVTHFDPRAHATGLGGNIVFNDRFVFSCAEGNCLGFTDKPYNIARALTPDVKTNDAIFEQWMRATNLLTMEKAQQIAESAMRSFGVPREKMDFKEPMERKQRKYEWEAGKIYPEPYYQFCWQTDKGACNVHVSGITSNVVEFYFIGPYLRFSKPTNYFEMLGLPSKPVFVRRFFTPPGQPQRYELPEPVK